MVPWVQWHAYRRRGAGTAPATASGVLLDDDADVAQQVYFARMSVNVELNPFCKRWTACQRSWQAGCERSPDSSMQFQKADFS